MSVNAQLGKGVAPQPGGFKSLSQGNYSIGYPSDWTVNTSGQMGTKFVILSPLASDSDSFQENVNLVIQDLSGHPLNLNDFTNLSVDQIGTFPNGRVIDKQLQKGGGTGHEYAKIIFTGDQNGNHLKFEQYYWIVGKEAYVLTFTALSSTFDNYKPVGEKMLNTFVFKNP